MRDEFLTNEDEVFLKKIKTNLKRCKSFMFSVSFIKKAGLILFEKEIEEALDRGVEGKIITSTYQNFTDIASLEKFLSWQKKYKNFKCRLDYQCFGDKGFHTKGYLFEHEESFELIVGSSNITRFALKNNQEWDLALKNNNKFSSFIGADKEFKKLWNLTLDLDEDLIDKYRLSLDYAIEKWDMDYINTDSESFNPNSMQRKALKELRRYRDMGITKALIISATGSGKTYLAAFDARNFDARRVLFIVHRETILSDALETFRNVFGSNKKYGYYTGRKQDLDKDFIFASSNMLARHIDEFDKKEFDYIVYDEVHHIVAECGKKIFEYFEPDFLLGLTATPERMDNKDVFNLFEQNVPFELRLREAILNDLVVPFHYYGIRDKLIDYKSIDKNDVAKEVGSPENINFICKQIDNYKLDNQKLKCIAFCSSIQHAIHMSEKFNESGYPSVALTGRNDTGQRIKAFNDLQNENNDLQIICTVDILNEGVDIPKINMVLFLRPTDSPTIFIQQLGRGLRKADNKEYLTVLDFIGNNYERSTQIAMALGTLGKTTYLEKTYLKDLIKTDFQSLDIPNLKIEIDNLSKEEIIRYIDNTNFNKKNYLVNDYNNFKKFLNKDTYPSHMDYLESDVAPDLNRFLKSKIGNGKNRSYYTFLSKIEEETLPSFNQEEIKLIDALEELLPIVRPDEYLIVKTLIEDQKVDFEKIVEKYPNTSIETLQYAYDYLKRLNIINAEIDISKVGGDLKEYLIDTVNYGLTRYEREFGNNSDKFKLYQNYNRDQVAICNLKNSEKSYSQMGTYYENNNKEVIIFVGLKKDVEQKLNYNDYFVDSKKLQWESTNNIKDSEVNKIRNSERVYIFIRKMENEDDIQLPYTYFGTGEFVKINESYSKEKGRTLITEIKLDNEVPKEYYFDFDIKEIS